MTCYNRITEYVLLTLAGMTIGGVRHVADIRADDMNKDGHAIISLQAGSNKGASQTGMSIGSVRHVSDIRADDLNKEGQSILILQNGYYKGATQVCILPGFQSFYLSFQWNNSSIRSICF